MPRFRLHLFVEQPSITFRSSIHWPHENVALGTHRLFDSREAIVEALVPLLGVENAEAVVAQAIEQGSLEVHDPDSGDDLDYTPDTAAPFGWPPEAPIIQGDILS